MPSGEQLERGRALCAQGAWADAHAALTAAEQANSLDAEDLRLLATAAYMLGRDAEYVETLGRAHQAQLDGDEIDQAARTAFWLGMHFVTTGDVGRGSGWIGRAQRLVEHLGEDCVERGYLLLPLAFRREAAGELAAAAETAGQAVALADRHGDQDLFALAAHTQGHLLVLDGRVTEGLALFDEAMLSVTTGRLSPIARGIVYCGVILGCQAAYEMRRAQEWTEELARWCERQPDMVAFSGRCHVHRAEIMQLRGAWSDALEEARYAERRAERGNQPKALAEAHYVQGEVHRLRGESGTAERCYRAAAELGRDPQPGVALLRLADGDIGAAAAAIDRALAETRNAGARGRLLPACAEIMLAAGDVARARSACEELSQIAASRGAGMLEAVAAQSRGAVDLAGGDAQGALVALRHAWRAWAEAAVPYEAARTRELVGLACRAVGDEDSARSELAAARRVFGELGAAYDVTRINAHDVPGTGAPMPDGLTARELEVLRLVAEGRTNRAIAEALVLSERTVERHVSNIFAKLRVSSRAAATAYAYEHRLL
ncbi:MAG: LuxR C-terminal-related transcriptional regulator [Solirubrobacteraceae bacterium]|nr:LuxR C-terminal-related transcriptional regulator [Solirubrobacteraceae bacterium]